MRNGCGDEGEGEPRWRWMLDLSERHAEGRRSSLGQTMSLSRQTAPPVTAPLPQRVPLHQDLTGACTSLSWVLALHSLSPRRSCWT